MDRRRLRTGDKTQPAALSTAILPVGMEPGRRLGYVALSLGRPRASMFTAIGSQCRLGARSERAVMARNGYP